MPLDEQGNIIAPPHWPKDCHAFVGIDPGKEGAFAVHLNPDPFAKVSPPGLLLYQTFHNPTPGGGDSVELNIEDDPEGHNGYADLLHTMRLLKSHCKEVHVWIEHLVPPQQASKHNCFKMGESFGRVQAVLDAIPLSYYRVIPTHWQRWAWVFTPKGTSYPERKKAGMRRAQRVYPQVPWDDYPKNVKSGIADAFLLAHAAYRRWKFRDHKDVRRAIDSNRYTTPMDEWSLQPVGTL